MVYLFDYIFYAICFNHILFLPPTPPKSSLPSYLPNFMFLHNEQKHESQKQNSFNFMCINVCLHECRYTICLPCVPAEVRRGHHMPWNWCYDAWTAMWVLETGPRSSARAMSALNCWVSSPAPRTVILVWHVCMDVYLCIYAYVLQVGVWYILYAILWEWL